MICPVQIKPFSESDISPIIELLRECNLPVSDVESGKQDFIIAETNGIIVGCIGLEVYGENGLLRSFAVKQSFRNQKTGEKLYRKILQLCDEKGVKQLFLLTTTAEGYFEKSGFCKIDRQNVPHAIIQTREFIDICPISAVVMQKTLDNK